MESFIVTSIYLISLGCSKNLVDSEEVLGDLLAQGFSLTSTAAEAGIFLINTCGFIASARKEGYAVIEEAVEWKEATGGLIAVIGCQAQKEAEILREAFPTLDVIAGFSGYGQLGALLKKSRTSTESPALLGKDNDYAVPRAEKPYRLTGGATAYMKLGEGCNKRCAFCTIPQIRGNQVSVPTAALRQRAEALAASGVREIILVSQDPVTYGGDFASGENLLAALDVIEAVDGIDWVRLHYLFPGAMAREVAERMTTGGKLLPYLDMPIQHAAPEILRAMRRPELGELDSFLLDLRARHPEIIFRTTLIVGFPGEAEAHFRVLTDFVKKLEIDRVGVFTFSPEPGTSAAALPKQVSGKVAAKRQARLLELARKISTQRQAQLIGTTQQVIIDQAASSSREDAYAVGRTVGQAPDVDGITHVIATTAQAGDILEVTVTGAAEYDLFATAISDSQRPRSSKLSGAKLRILPN